MKKRIFTFLLVAIMSFSLSPSVFAMTSEEEIISYEEFITTVQEAYAKYNITYEILEDVSDYTFTRSLLEKKLEQIEKDNKHLLNQESSPLTNTFIKNIKPANENDLNSVMPITKHLYYYKTCSASDGIGWARICVDLTISADVEHNDLLSIINYTSYPSGSNINFGGWSELYKSATPNYVNDYVDVSITGDLRCEYTDPTTGFLVGSNTQHTLSCRLWVES